MTSSAVRTALATLAALLVSSAARASDGEYFARAEYEGRKHGSLAGTRAIGAGGSIETREQLTLAIRGTGEVETLRVATTWRENAEGALTSWTRVSEQGRVRDELRARADAESVEIVRRRGLVRDARSLPRPPDWLGPAALARRVEALVARGEGSVRYRELDPGRLGFREIELSLAPGARDASGRLALRKRVRRGSAEHVESAAWHADAGRLLDSYSLLGVRLALTPASALSAFAPNTPIDAMDALLVRSPFRISEDASKGAIRYVLEAESGAALAVPETAEQSATIDGTRSIVAICADCGNASQPNAAELAAALAPNDWVESAHPRLVRAANEGAAPGESVDARMQRLIRRVRERLDGPVEALGYASAYEAWRARRGDCTEFAVLLAALARANGIPARVAFGLVYSSRFSGRAHVFSPHAWVIAWDGTHWASYDGAAGPFGATHIALALGDGSPDAFAEMSALLPELRIREAARIDASPLVSGEASGGP